MSSRTARFPHVRFTSVLAALLVASIIASCASGPSSRPSQEPITPPASVDVEAALAESKALIAALDFQGALKRAGVAVEAAGDNAVAWRWFATALAYSGDLERALEAFDKAVALEPGNPAILNSRAIFLAKTGQATRAVADADAALALPLAASNAALRGAILDTKAWAMFLAGDYAGARAAEKQAVVLAPFLSGYAPLLEFRLISAERGAAAARDYADRTLASGGLPALAAQALRIMTGEMDIRDMVYESAYAVTDFALYISGFQMTPPEPAALSVQPAIGAVPQSAKVTVVLVTEPDAIGADETTVTVAKLAYRNGLTNAGVFSVVDSDSRKAAIKELELSLSGLTAGEMDKAAGALFSANFVASGSIARSDAGWLVAFTFSDASTGRILASDMALVRDHAAILDLAARFCASLAAMMHRGNGQISGW